MPSFDYRPLAFLILFALTSVSGHSTEIRPSELTIEELSNLLGVKATVANANFKTPKYIRLVETQWKKNQEEKKEYITLTNPTKSARITIALTYESDQLKEVKISLRATDDMNGAGSAHFIRIDPRSYLTAQEQTMGDVFSYHIALSNKETEGVEILVKLETSDTPFAVPSVK